MTTDAFHLLLAWATVLGAVGCGSTSSATSQIPIAQRPELASMPESLNSDYQVFAYNCSKCHDADRALNAPVSDNHHWELYVGKMMRTPGSGISKVEAPHILRFLFWYTDRKAGRVAEFNEATRVEPAGTGALPAAPTVEPPAPSSAPPVEPSAAPETQGESTP